MDEDVDYKVSYATRKLISLEWTNSYYGHGAAHGFGDISVKNEVLLLCLHQLTGQDVFRSDEDQIVGLRRLFQNALKKQGWVPRDGQDDIEILEIVQRYDKWSFSTEGLTVSFNSYDGGCYACTPQPLTVPWSELRPLLADDAVVP